MNSSKNNPDRVDNVVVSFEDYGVASNKCIITDTILGEGTWSQVFKGYANEETIGIKRVKKEWMNWGDMCKIHEEIAIHNSLSHKNIITLKGTQENEISIDILLEYGDQDLGSKLKYKKLDENDAKEIVKGITNGLEYIHDKNIIHCDIKPKNILLKEGIPKICDFGLAKRGKDVVNTEICGSNGFIAPELFNRNNYTPKVDMWSLGIITFIMIGGYHPYIGNKNKFNYNGIEFLDRYWNHTSNQSKNFISNLLRCNPNSRMSSEEAISHPWLKI